MATRHGPACLLIIMLCAYLLFYHWVLPLRRQAKSTMVISLTHKQCISVDANKTSTTTRPNDSSLEWCQMLKFQVVPGPTVALASYPGSGNTWVRYLLQQATGIYTGSVYKKDKVLLKNGFPAEGVVNGSVLVVKTHKWKLANLRMFSKAVLIIRAPSDAIQAEFNRKFGGGHTGFSSTDSYMKNGGKNWQKFVSEQLLIWHSFNVAWVQSFSGPLHVIFYEQLVENVEQELRRLLDFLHVAVNPADMACALARQEGIYRRKHPNKLDPFTDTMKEMLRKEQDLVYDVIKNKIIR